MIFARLAAGCQGDFHAVWGPCPRGGGGHEKSGNRLPPFLSEPLVGEEGCEIAAVPLQLLSGLQGGPEEAVEVIPLSQARAVRLVSDRL